MDKKHSIGKRGRIILVNPGLHLFAPLKDVGMFPNNAIQILGTILHQNQFDIRIVDGRYLTIKEAADQILNLISEDTVFIGFSVMTIQLKWAYLVSRAVKQARPHVKIVWGGVHPTLFPEQTVLDEALDFCVVNECAATIVQFAAALADNADLSNIPGLCYKHNGGVFSTVPNTIPDDFTNIPYIDFSIMDHKRYSKNNNIAIDSSIGDEYKRYVVYPINTSLGCNFRCNFCINVILGRDYKKRSAEEIIERIKYLKAEYGANYIHIVDENFFGDKKRVYEFVEALLAGDINIKWRVQLRADYFNDNYINKSFIKELEKAGLLIAVMGVESASQRVLDMLNKKMKVEAIMNALEILNTTKIIPRLSFMAGMPGEAEKEMQSTYRLAVVIKERFPASESIVTPFRLYPGSKLYDLAVSEYGYKTPKSLAEWAELADREYSDGVGYQNPRYYPWITNQNTFQARHRTFTIFRILSWSLSPYVLTNVSKKIKYNIKRILCKISAARLKNSFYRLNVEYALLKLLGKVRE